MISYIERKCSQTIACARRMGDQKLCSLTILDWAIRDDDDEDDDEDDDVLLLD